MKKVLIIYATTHGHTAKIAGRLSDAIHSEGLEVDCRDVARSPETDPASYDAVIAGASLHQSTHQPEMVQWVKSNRDVLATRPTAFLSVSLTAAADEPEAREATEECIRSFLEETGWRPDRTEAVAGCLQYREYDRFTRSIIRLMMKRGGHPTDTSRDHEFTDWEALADFGRDFAKRL